MKDKFIYSLENNDLEQLKTVQKSDLHNHAPRGGNVKFIEKWSQTSIQRPPTKFKDLSDMQRWYEENIKILCQGQIGYCPTSNVMLSRVKDHKHHPIKELYHSGIRITINSDDMLIFNQSVSEDYLNIFNAGILSSSELNEIRETGLTSSKRKKK